MRAPYHRDPVVLSRSAAMPDSPGFMGRVLLLILFSCLAVPLTCPAAQPEDAPEETDLQARGLVRARHRTVLSSEIAGRILRIPYREGAAFKKGAVLVRLDGSLLKAEKAKAEASLEAARKKLHFHRRLEELQSIGALEVALDEALVQEREAECRIASLALGRCTLHAPYSGRVVRVIAREHQSVKAQQELLEILASGSLELEIMVPSDWLGWMRKGLAFSIRVDETGETLPASVQAVGAAVDPVSKTVRLRGRIEAPCPGLVPGMGATALFERP